MPGSRQIRKLALRESPWTPLTSRRLPGVSTRMHAWLRDPGSLTRSVVASCREDFRVELIGQAHGAALPGEAALLMAGSLQANLVREVRLYCGHQAWVFARTLIPLHSLRGPAFCLSRLGQRPLGAVLFSDPTTRRRCVEVARITPRHHLFECATDHLEDKPSEIYGRRTLFEYRRDLILVNELFLPGIGRLRG